MKGFYILAAGIVLAAIISFCILVTVNSTQSTRRPIVADSSTYLIYRAEIIQRGPRIKGEATDSETVPVYIMVEDNISARQILTLGDSSYKAIHIIKFEEQLTIPKH